MNIIIINLSKTIRTHLKDSIEHWFGDNGRLDDLCIDECTTISEAIDHLESKKFDLVFVSKILKDHCVFDFVNMFHDLKLTNPPKICVTTVSKDEELTKTLLDLGVYRSFERPINAQDIKLLMEEIHFIETIEDQFLDFDEVSCVSGDLFDSFDDFLDFDDDNSFDTNEKHQSQYAHLMDEFNLSHRHLHAEKFLATLPNLSQVRVDLDHTNKTIKENLYNLQDDPTMKNYEVLIDNIKLYTTLLAPLDQFRELIISLNIFKELMEQIEIYDDEEIMIYVVSFFEDLINWSEFVFVQGSAKDVFYINASSLNNCIDFETILHTK